MRRIRYLVLSILGLIYFETRDAEIMPRNASDFSFGQFSRTGIDLPFSYSPRLPKPKQKTIPVSNQMVIKEKRKGYADRGKEYAGFVTDKNYENIAVIPGPVGFYSNFDYRPRHLSGSRCIRPPPVC